MNAINGGAPGLGMSDGRASVTIGNTPAGGPHWGAMDNLVRGDGRLLPRERTSRSGGWPTANYFVARHRARRWTTGCGMTDIDRDGLR